MEYIKDDLSNTNLPILVICKKEKYRKYPQIGYGDEGSVHKYNKKYAFKTFDFISKKERLTNKFKKLELLGQLKDDSVCFPIGIIGYEDMKKEGYYYDLVNPHEKYKDFNYLNFLKDMKKVIEYIIKASDTIKRVHELGIIIGDVKDDNIMIDKCDNIKFVDTDNWMYKDYSFDIVPGRSKKLNEFYKKDFPLIENDKFVFGMMAIQFFVKGDIVSLHTSYKYFETLIEYMNIDKNQKEGLKLIFSDALNKPYIGDIFKEINLEEELLSKDAISKTIFLR